MKTLIRITRKLRLLKELTVENVEQELLTKISYNTMMRSI